MEENPELEEGEAFQYMDDGYNNNMDPDIALSYIDEKVQNVLGHFQKYFEGGVSAENLGAKFGGYGSFLPTYERSPQRSSVPSHPKTPQRNCSAPRSPNNLPMEGASQSVKVPLNDAPSVKLGISSGNSNALRKSGLASGNVPVKQESNFSKNPLKSGRFSDQRTLKVRIKVGPDSVARKNAAIYNGLGLGNSPSSSFGNSPEVSGGMPLQQTADESPTGILQVMTSFPVPGGAMISPLHDNLLCLIKKETFSRDVKPDPFLKGGRINSALSEKESVSLVGNEKLSKGKGVKFPMKSQKAEVKRENDIVSRNGTAFSTKMNLEIENSESQKVVSNTNNLKSMHLRGTANGNGALKAAGRPSEVPLVVDEDGVGGRIFSSDLMKEDSLESRSGQDSGKSEKRNAQTQSGAVEKVPEHWEVPYDNDGSVHLKGNKKTKKSKTRAPSKAYSDASGNKQDLAHGSLVPSKQKIVQQAAFCVQDEFLMSSLKEKPLSEGKKLHGSKSSKKAVAHGSLEISVNRESKDLTGSTHGVSKSKDKMQKLKFQDSSKFKDNLKDLTKLEQKSSQMRFLERPSGNRQKGSIIDVRNASFDSSKEGFSGKEVDNQLIHSSFKDVANVGISLAGNPLASEVAPPVPTVVIEENWVCCDSCQKWRLLPHGTLPEQLPEKWLCSMLNWLPGMNQCDISEEETTKALHALYHVPLAVGQNNLQNDTNRTTSGVHVQHDLSHQSLNSLSGPTQGKKKHRLKETANAGISSGMMRSSNSPNNQFQEPVKSRSINNMIQPPVESNLVNKSSSYTVSKSRNVVAEVKQDPGAGGNTKQVKMKNKREADHYGYGDSKKTKTDVSDADKHYNSDTGSGRLGLNSKTGLSIKVRGKDILKSNDCSFSGDVKCDTKERFPVSVNKLYDRSQMSSGGGLNVRTSDKMNISMKKRKLKEWQDDQNGLDGTGNAEDSSESGLKKVKKLKVSKSGASVMNNSREKLDKKEKMAHILSSGSQDHAVDGVDAERRTHKDQRPRKHRRSFTSQQRLDGTDTSRKDLGLGQLSTTATSSSSKVSGSLKTQTALDDVKNSPVESVSSSPMRIPFSEKLGSTGGEILGKDDATDGGHELMTGWDRKGDDQINQSGTGKEKVSGSPHPEAFTCFSLDYQDGDAKRKFHQTKRKFHQTKCSSQLLNGGGEIMERHKSSVDLFATKNSHDEVRVEKNLNENMLPLHKSSKGPSLQLKENDRSLISDFDRDPKLSELGNAQVDILNKRTRKESEVDLGSHTSLHKRMNNVKHSIPDKPSNKFSKDEKVHVSRSSSASHFSKDDRMEIPLKQDPDDPNKKLVSLDSRKRNAGPRGNLPDSDSEIKVDSVHKELKTETSTLVPHMEWEVKHESHIHQSARCSQQEGSSDGHSVHASGNVDVSKASRRPGSCGKMNGVQCMLDARSVKDLSAPIPASSQTATNTLKEAKNLRDYADQLKSSGFGFESNEINFQAALKFLHGASLLETSNEVGRQGEMTEMQAYSMTAKLCECCAVEYERRCEMAAAALAYKCMEVAHWRIVYCKNSSLSRDRNELQACLQTFPQGESPSSSASDIDNLNNQATVDKVTVSKSAISHVAGNPVIVARNHSNFLRLLDFTQDVNFAVVASRKSQNAYSAANVALEEAQNKDCIVSVKKVIDFSFQDVEELLHLVQQAMEAITRAGLIDKRD